MPAASTPPNIVFVHVDQLRHDALSAYGNKHVHTPNIDRIIAAGTSFHYSYSGNPVCCPARACWYTGRASSEHGVVKNQEPLLPSVPDLGQWMGERGYRCFYTGKWHVPHRPLDQSFTVLPGGDGHGERGDAGVASTAAGFIRNYERNRPFFLNVGFLNPHDCCFLTFAPKNPATKFALADTLRDQFPPLPGSCDVSGGMKTSEGGLYSADDVRMYGYYYYRMVEMVDAEVGRVYEALRTSLHAENTLFVFSSDHGEMLGHNNLFKKGVLYDSALRVPLAFTFPGKIRPGVLDREHLVLGLDVPATILDYAGLEAMPKTSIAKSLRPILEGRGAAWRDYAVAESTTTGGLERAVCTKGHKAVFGPQGSVALYDMEADPLETRNVADHAEYAETLAQARARHNEYIDRIELHADYTAFGKV